MTTTYREAARLLGRLTGLVVAADTIRVHTTAVGEQVAAVDEAAIAQVQATREAAEPVAPVPGTLVVQTDGAMVHYLDGWHEVEFGVVGGAGDGHLVAASYVAARESADAFGPRLVAEAARRGALEVVGWEGGIRGRGLAVLPPVHIVGDGAAWIWNLAADHFGKRTEVLDFYHAAEHVWAVARAVYGTDADDARVGATVLVRAMRLAGAQPVQAALAALPVLPPAVADLVRVARGYFTTNATRMDYAGLAMAGLPIGSGAVESAARHVVQQRMKRPGHCPSARTRRARSAGTPRLRASAAPSRVIRHPPTSTRHTLRCGGWAPASVVASDADRLDSESALRRRRQAAYGVRKRARGWSWYRHPLMSKPWVYGGGASPPMSMSAWRRPVSSVTRIMLSSSMGISCVCALLAASTPGSWIH